MKSSDKMVATEASTPGQPLGMNLSLVTQKIQPIIPIWMQRSGRSFSAVVRSSHASLHFSIQWTSLYPPLLRRPCCTFDFDGTSTTSGTMLHLTQ